MATKWLPLDPAEWNKPQRKSIHGVTVNMYLSPQDVPEAVQGFYDEAMSCFAIEFRYPTGEEHKSNVAYDPHVTLTVGKNSNRLYRIGIDVDRLQAKSVGLYMYVQAAMAKDVPHAIEQLASERKRALREGNYRLAEEVIVRHKDELLQAVPG